MPSPAQIANSRKKVEEVVSTISTPIAIVTKRFEATDNLEQDLDHEIEDMRVNADARIKEIQDQLERDIAPLLHRREGLDADRQMLKQLLDALTPSEEKLREAIALIAPSGPAMAGAGATSGLGALTPTKSTSTIPSRATRL